MAFDAEKEIYKTWRSKKAAQDEIGKMYMRWRQVALELAGEKAKPLDVSLKCSEIMGREVGKSWLPRMSFAKGEENWLKGLTMNYIAWWTTLGASIKAQPGEKPFEVFLSWNRCPWPTFCKEYEVPMEEDVLCCDAFLKHILKDVNVFFNVEYDIETLKAIPRGQGQCLRRLFKVEK